MTMRAQDRGHRDRGVLPARRRAHREGRVLHQHPAAAAVAPPGGRAARGRARRPVVHLPPRPPDQGEAGSLRRGDGPAHPGSHLGLPGERRARRTRRRSRPRGDQRLGRRREAAVVVRAAQRRRIDRLRLLDLLRERMGLGLACEPAGSVQPRLGRPRRQAVERAQGAGLVGCGPGHVVGHDIADFTADKPPNYQPPERRDRPGGPVRHRPVHHAGRRQGLAVRARRIGGRPAAPRTTSRRTRHSPTCCTARTATGAAGGRVQAPGQPDATQRRRAGRRVFPYVATTYRLTEHHTAGGMAGGCPTCPSCSPSSSARSRPGSPPSAAWSTWAGPPS